MKFNDGMCLVGAAATFDKVWSMRYNSREKIYRSTYIGSNNVNLTFDKKWDLDDKRGSAV